MSVSDSSTDRSRPYVRVAVALSPLLFSTLQPILPVYIRHLLAPYTPRAVIHSTCHPLSPLLLGPIALSPSLGAYISRILQSALLWCLPPDTALWAWAYFIVLAFARVLTGFLLTRAVGWAAPAWFSHWALYEVSGGFGPGLMAVLAFRGLHGANAPFGLMEGGDSRYSLWGLGLVTLVFCWSEVAPWTYAHAWLGILLLKGGLWVGVRCRAYHGTADERAEQWEMLHSSETNDSLSSSDTLIAYDLPVKGRTGYTTLPWAHAPLSMLLAALAILLPYLATISRRDPVSFILSREPIDGLALLDILVLTYPRPPNTDVSAQVLNTTITSYLPFLSNDITLAVFTHAADHPAFDRVRDSYILDNGSPSSVDANPHLTFYQDLDGHPSDQSGHFLHLAEAFRWAEEQRRAEWIMLVEDDFPVCDNGWRYIAQVVEQLESDKSQSGRIRYGWVGTGGSGLIIHHSLLPLLSYLLHTYSSSDPIAPDSVVHPAPDELVQACLLGRHSACLPTSHNPHHHPSIMQTSDIKGGYYGEPQPQMIITSRLVIDHIGGLSSTTEGKAGNTDKWRCGWRHPYHGADEVEVVVVPYYNA